MRLKCLEHYDIFSEEIALYFDVEEVLPEYVEKAKEIDGENYSESCFGFCMNSNLDLTDHWVVTDNNNELYYIDNDGGKHYLEDSKVDLDVVSEAVELAKKEISFNNVSILMEKALLNYPNDNLEINVDLEKNLVCGMYHSAKDSFGVTESYDALLIDMDKRQ